MKEILEDRYYARKGDPLAIAYVWDLGRMVHIDAVHGDVPSESWGRAAFRREFALIEPEPECDGSRYWIGELCECCFIALVNGDGCQCPEDDEECHPSGLIGKLADDHVTPGSLAQEHDSRCPVSIYGRSVDGFECDCERSEFSTSQCDGCGTYLAGRRESVTGWLD